MRIVVKVGTSTLTHATGRLNIRIMNELVKTLSDIANMGNEIVLVSSGAVGLGVGKLNLLEKPKDMPTKQAAAAVGQCELMYTYDKLFSEYNHTVAQVLLTGHNVTNDKKCRANVENTMNRLLELGTIPIINENDTVSTDELDEVNSLGDNDTLSAIVAVSVKADLLVLMSDIDGLYTADPHKDKNAKLISRVTSLDDDVFKLGAESAGKQGTGGMKTKLSAAKLANENGISMLIVNGSDPKNLYRIIDGEIVGTKFVGKNRD